MQHTTRKFGATKGLRYNELKTILQAYNYLQLRNRMGLVIIVRSKDILKHNQWLDTDLETGWIDWQPLTLLGYLAHKYLGWYAD